MKIALGSDHAGYELKEKFKEVLRTENIEYQDFGPFSEESVDYPDFGHKVGASVDNGEFDRGIAICGSGNGINMTVNKYKNVRAALCWTNEICELARQHNNANVLSIPARFISTKEAVEILHTYIKTEFEGGRHERRITKI